MALPPEYAQLSEEAAIARAAAAKVELGSSVVILAHHYQRDSIVALADFVGDSLELSQKAAAARQARAIVFCGVDFMAETAAMLAAPDQLVLLPAHTALCPMAAMTTRSQAVVAYTELSQKWGWRITPITYQNSYAEVKAFCGEHDGAVCTSSNARAVLEWALAQTGHVLFMPDENLGTNSAISLGIPRSRIGLWDPNRASAFPQMDAQVVVWKGFCSVHTRFKLEDVRAFRSRYPTGKVIVHPECTPDVVAASDASASTSGIMRYVRDLPPGSVVAVGTECNLVSRLTQQTPDRTVMPLRDSRCATMYRVTPQHVAYTLEELCAGRAVGRVQVASETTHWANVALAKMLAFK